MKLLKCFAALMAALMPAAALATGAAKDGKVVVAYVTSWTDEMPDPSVMTHVNYAFGHVNESFDGVRVDNPERLRQMVALKNDAPHLNVLLSVGGWESGRFSEMADDDSLRMAFARDCLRVVTEYGLDGIDIDWEYPGSDAAGISCSERDTGNFTLLMRDLREALGPDLFLTMAVACDPQYIDYPSAVPYVDFVSLMTYDMGDAPIHHAALYPSENTGQWTCDTSVKAHIAAGVPPEKLVLGMPFYGRGGKEMKGRDYKRLDPLPEGCVKCFDKTARVPYVANSSGVLVIGYDDPASIAEKCRYILDNGLHGAMYWDCNGDDPMLSLSRTVGVLIMDR